MSKGVEILIVKGDTYKFYGAVYDAAGFPKDLTSWTITGGIKYNYTDGANAATFVVTKTDAANGEFTATLDETVTAGLTPAKFLGGPPVGVYDIKMTDGTDVVTLFHGKVRVEPEVV